MPGSLGAGRRLVRARRDPAKSRAASRLPELIYAYFYRNTVYAWRALREASGLLWNPYQSCAQPFFGISTTGLLYPVNLVFGLLSREPALLTSLMLNLCIAGGGAYLLCRSRTSTPPAGPPA